MGISTSSTNDPAWSRLEDQLGWYDKKSMVCQKAYKRIKTAQLILGGAVPVLAWSSCKPSLPPWLRFP